MPDDQLLTIAQAAEYLGVSRSTVERWISTGRLPSVLLSPAIRRIRQSDLAAFIDQHQD